MPRKFDFDNYKSFENLESKTSESQKKSSHSSRTEKYACIRRKSSLSPVLDFEKSIFSPTQPVAKLGEEKGLDITQPKTWSKSTFEPQKTSLSQHLSLRASDPEKSFLNPRKSFNGPLKEQHLSGHRKSFLEIPKQHHLSDHRQSVHESSSDPLIFRNKSTFQGAKKHILDLDKSYYPSDFIHGLLSSCAYKNHQEGSTLVFPKENAKARYNEYLTNWKVKKVFSPKKSDDYYSALYTNDSEKYAVLAHRGTDIKGSIIGFNQSLKADMIEILSHNIGVQQIAAYAATQESIEILNSLQDKEKVKYHFSITGHSLGAWLAELSLYFCHKDFKVHDAKAVTFDSPGSKDHLKNFVSNITNRNTEFDLDNLNLTTYLSAPNLVNVCNKHFGKVYRIYPKIADPKEIIKKSLDEPKVKLASVKKLYGKFEHIIDPISIFQKIIDHNDHYAYAFLSLVGHSLDPIIATFDPQTGLPNSYKEMDDWPLLKHENIGKVDVVERALSEVAGYLKVPKFLGDIASKRVAELIPKTTTHSMVNVIAEFLDGNIDMGQICASFQNLENGSLGFQELKLKDSNAEFSMLYNAHYRVKEIDPYKIITKRLIKSEPQWFLHKIGDIARREASCKRKYHAESGEGVEIDVTNNLPVPIKSGLRTIMDSCESWHDTSSKEYIILANNQTINWLINAAQNFIEYDNNLGDIVAKLKSNLLFYEHNNLSRQAAVEKIFSNLPQKIDGFVGREDVFEKLDKIFSNSDIASISAFAGTGKTSTALEYGHRAKKSGTLVKWICSETPEKINASYRDLADELGINVENYIVSSDSYQSFNKASKFNTQKSRKGPNMNDNVVGAKTLDMDSLIKAVHTKIAKSHANTLFIFDNVEQYDDIQNHISSLRNLPIKALITTRDQNLIDNRKNNIELNALSKQEAVSYITNTLENRVMDSDAKMLIDFLGGGDLVLPYSLNQAVTFLEANPLWSVQKYIKYRQHHPENAESTMLFDQIAKNNETAWQILQYSSLMDPDFIDVKIFGKLLALNKNSLQQAITDLQKLSLVKIDHKSQEGQKGITIHRKLQTEFSQYAEHNPTLCLEKAFMVNNFIANLADKMPLVENKPDEKWKEVEKLYPHIENLLQSDVSLDKSDELISVYTKMAEYEKIVTSNYDRSLSLHQQALKTCENIYGPRHAKIVQIYTKIANIFRTKKDYDKALEYNQKSLSLIEDEKIPIDDKTKADSFYELSCAYYFLKQYETALEYDLKSLEIRQNLYKGDHPDIAQSLNAIGATYDSLEQYNKALEYYLKSLDMRQNLYKGDHPDITQSLNNIGCSYGSLNQYDKALEYELKALEMRQNLYQGDHPDIAQSLNNIGCSYGSLNQYEKGLGYELKALEMRQNLYQVNHSDIVQSLNNIGDSYNLLKQYDKGLEYKLKALEMCQNLYQGDHLDIARALEAFGMSYIVRALKLDLKLIMETDIDAVMDKKIEKIEEAETIGVVTLETIDMCWTFIKEAILAVTGGGKLRPKIDLNIPKLLMSVKTSVKYSTQAREMEYVCNLQNGNKKEIENSIKNFIEDYEFLSYLNDTYKYRLKKYKILEGLLSEASQGGIRPIIVVSELAKKESILDLEPIMSKIKGDLNTVIDKASTGEWGKVSSRFSGSPIGRKSGISKYVEEKHIKAKLGSNLAANKDNIERAKMLYLEAICLSIAKVPVEQRNYKCLEEFTKKYPEIVNKTFSHHPEYFIDENILQHCSNLPGVKNADEAVMKIIPKLNQCFSAEEIETKEEEPEIQEDQDLGGQFMLASLDQSDEMSLSGESL